MLHHRIQTDLKGVDAYTPASTPCTMGLMKSSADCRALCGYDHMIIIIIIYKFVRASVQSIN